MPANNTAPHAPEFDSSLALLRTGFRFLPNRFHAAQSDVIRLRLLLQPALALTGAEGAQLFYDTSKFVRAGAVPKRIQKTLFGTVGVQTLDGAAHAKRKALFMEVMGPVSLARLSGLMEAEWQAALARWQAQPQVNLFAEAQQLLCRAACSWAGVPLPETAVENRARDLALMVDSFARLGLRHWQGRLARIRTERWLTGIVKDWRRQRTTPDPASPAQRLAFGTDERGALLPARTAAVEIINLIRPTVAISYFVSFIAHALHVNPGQRARLQLADETTLGNFVSEVRRLYPFAPFVGARVKESFEWHGQHFPKGRLVLLDLYGIDHDPRLWREPDRFLPERFNYWNGSPYNFVPQGGGAHATGHRCAGEWVVIEAMQVALRMLTSGITYDVPQDQDLTIDMAQIPAKIASGFVITNVRPVAQPKSLFVKPELADSQAA